MRLSMADIRILSDGMMFYQNQFLNIHTDIPSKERKEINDQEPVFESKQSRYNSAELFNRELRARYKVISYNLNDLCFKYSTKDFLNLKYTEIISLSAYLIKVLDMLLEINRVFFRDEKEKEAYNSRHRKNKTLKPDQQFWHSLESVKKYLSLISDIKVSISTLTACPENVNIIREYDELLYSFRINLELTAVPEEILKIIDLILPGLQVRRIDTDNLNDPKNLKDILCFLNFENKLYLLLKLFRDKLVNQFSYYVTSDEFLNNPIRKTVFVVDSATYRKLNFPASGLYQDEIFEIEKSACGSYIYQKLEDFYKELQNYFTQAILDSKEQLETLETFEDRSIIQNFIYMYEMATRNKTGVGISRLKAQMENPRYHEALNNLLIRNRLYMYKVLENLDIDRIAEKRMEKNLPWNRVMENSGPSDINALHFIYDIQKRYFPEKSVPYAACQRVFNLFSACSTVTRRGFVHFKKFSTMTEDDFPESYKKEYIPLLQL